MDDDDFELQFADELDALDDFDGEYGNTPIRKGKKSLNFSTPSVNVRNSPIVHAVKTHGNNLDESLSFEPLNKTEESPSKFPNDSFKRKRQNDSSNNEPDLALVEDSSEVILPLSKKQKTSSYVKETYDQEEYIGEPPFEKYNKLSTDGDQETGENIYKQKAHGFEGSSVLHSIPAVDYVPVTDNSGSRFYICLKDEDELDVEIQDVTSGYKPSQLLGFSFCSLKTRLEEKRCASILRESENVTQSVSKQLQSQDHDGNGEVKSLWVDRYAPGRYTELLSDEATNRIVLKWLKLWDLAVFNKEKKIKEQPPEKEEKKEKKFFSKNQQELTEDLDQYNRPLFKAVLLSGPPGLGKTTLAHVIAKHAGYNVVEINASDDRSVDVFKQKLEAATQMKAVLGADPRPNCLVIDEIDGSPVATINVLLTLIKDAEGITKKKKRPQILMRPIICICNDLYVPALRLLRQNALVVNFPPTLPTQLAGRLLEICTKENIHSDVTTLLALGEKTDNDIRSCLNTLQFVKGKGNGLTLNTIDSMSLGQKDTHKSLFSTWQHIFRMPKLKRTQYINPYDRSQNPSENKPIAVQQSNTSLSARFDKALQVTIAAGETEKITQGLFENYLESKVKDARLDAVLKATEWLQFMDVISTEVFHCQDYSLLRYTSYLPVTFHLLFASNAPQKIVFPVSQHENNVKRGKSQNLVTTLSSDVCPQVKKNLNVTVTVTELLHPLLDIMQPTVRPVNTQLFSAREKEELSHLIEIMIAYNICYRQERTFEGQYVYVLDPNIEELGLFPDLKPRKQMTYAAKQLISREIELEKMRRKEWKEEGRNIMRESKQSEINKTEKHKGTNNLPNHKRQTLEVLPVLDKDDREYVDFFGRRIHRTIPETKIKNEKKKEERIGGEIWFKFKEGFSNAVRRTVRMSDFL